MSLRKRIKKKNEDRDWRPVTDEVASHFLEELRQARLAAQKDAEAFGEILFVVERIGSFRLGEVAALGDYEESLMDLAGEALLGQNFSPSQSVWHSEKSVLFRLVKDARNDALHQGAKARYLTEHTIELALILEDALMNGKTPMTTLGDIMVRSPVTAEAWQPVSLVRKTMLTNSYSFLPIKRDGDWKLISDVRLAEFLRKDNPSNGERKKLLAMTLEEAHAKGLVFEDTFQFINTATISELAIVPLEHPRLVIDKPGNLVGIVTAFDIL